MSQIERGVIHDSISNPLLDELGKMRLSTEEARSGPKALFKTPSM
jgi:hypothetical protein